MKKKNYALVASFLMMLVATLTSCEKFALDETSTDPHDANANVTFHVSMGKNQSTEFKTKAAGFNTKARESMLPTLTWHLRRNRKGEDPQHPIYRQGIRQPLRLPGRR